MSAGYRAVTAFLLVTWIIFYILLAWYIGGFIPVDSDFIELAYYPIAGLAWIPVAAWILKKRHREET